MPGLLQSLLKFNLLTTRAARVLYSVVAVCGATACLTGCANVSGREQGSRPANAGNVYSQSATLPPGFRRVAVLPVSFERADLEAGRDLVQPIVSEELANLKRFEVVTVSPEELEQWTGRQNWPSARPWPAELPEAVEELLVCDGLLFVQLTQFHAYPPVAVGWNLKLMDIRTGEIIWAADEVFDAGDSRIAAGAKKYHQEQSVLPRSLRDPGLILISPTQFSRYSLHLTFSSLPPVSGLNFCQDRPITR